MFAGGLRKRISGNARRCCSLNAQQISVPAWYKAGAGNPTKSYCCTVSENSPGPLQSSPDWRTRFLFCLVKPESSVFEVRNFVVQVEDLRGLGKRSPPSDWSQPACSTVASGPGLFLIRTVFQHLDFFEGNQSFQHHLFQVR